MGQPRLLSDVECTHCKQMFRPPEAGRTYCSSSCYQLHRFPLFVVPPNTKRCVECKETKPRAEYHKHSLGRDGLQARCKSCNIAAAKARYVADPERRKAYVKKWQAENPDRRWKASRKNKLKGYGLTLDEYDAMLNRQGGRCAICQTDVPGRGRKMFSVDHDHKTGAVRGLVCGACNQGLGCFRDNPESLAAAMRYLATTDE